MKPVASFVSLFALLGGCAASAPADESPIVGAPSAANSSDAQQRASGASPAAPGASSPSASPAPDVLAKPIVPPRYAAGVDFWGGDAHPRATEDSVLSALPMLTLSPLGGPATTYSWRGKLDVSFGPDDHRVRLVTFYAGYPGKVSFRSSPSSSFGQHDYALSAGAAIQRDGAAWNIDWKDHGNSAGGFELCRAMLATFGQGPKDETMPLSADDCDWSVLDDAAMVTVIMYHLGFNLALDLDRGGAPGASKVWAMYMRIVSEDGS